MKNYLAIKNMNLKIRWIKFRNRLPPKMSFDELIKSDAIIEIQAKDLPAFVADAVMKGIMNKN